VRNAILDGEIVCLDEHGISQFNHLLNRKAEPIFYAFDQLWLDGEDLRRLPMVVRKKRLTMRIRSSECSRVLYAPHIEGEGKRMFQEICARDLEGIVAKRKMGIYKNDGNDWVKVKNRKYSQAEGRQDLMRG
jgi:bifunctional non-homologous end joining protein LigD